MCLLYLKVICARPWGPKEAFWDLQSPKTPLLTASFLRPKALKDPVFLNQSAFTRHIITREEEVQIFNVIQLSHLIV